MCRGDYECVSTTGRLAAYAASTNPRLAGIIVGAVVGGVVAASGCSDPLRHQEVYGEAPGAAAAAAAAGGDSGCGVERMQQKMQEAALWDLPRLSKSLQHAPYRTYCLTSKECLRLTLSAWATVRGHRLHIHRPPHTQ